MLDVKTMQWFNAAAEWGKPHALPSQQLQVWQELKTYTGHEHLVSARPGVGKSLNTSTWMWISPMQHPAYYITRKTRYYLCCMCPHMLCRQALHEQTSTVLWQTPMNSTVITKWLLTVLYLSVHKILYVSVRSFKHKPITKSSAARKRKICFCF